MGLLARLQGEKRTRGTERNISLIYGLISPNFDCGTYFVEWFVSCSFKIISLRARKSPKFSAGWRESWPQGALPHFPVSAVSTTTHLWMWGFLKGPKEYWKHPNTRENMPLRIYCKAPYSQSHNSRRKVKVHHSLSCSIWAFFFLSPLSGKSAAHHLVLEEWSALHWEQPLQALLAHTVV